MKGCCSRHMLTLSEARSEFHRTARLLSFEATPQHIAWFKAAEDEFAAKEQAWVDHRAECDGSLDLRPLPKGTKPKAVEEPKARRPKIMPTAEQMQNAWENAAHVGRGANRWSGRP